MNQTCSTIQNPNVFSIRAPSVCTFCDVIYESPSCVFQDLSMLKRMKAALWFIIEPLMVRNEAYSFGFYKALIEKIKNHRDALEPQNEAVNKVTKLFSYSTKRPHLIKIIVGGFWPEQNVLTASRKVNVNKSYPICTPKQCCQIWQFVANLATFDYKLWPKFGFGYLPILATLLATLKNGQKTV